jgi:hypothetical protein
MPEDVLEDDPSRASAAPGAIEVEPEPSDPALRVPAPPAPLAADELDDRPTSEIKVADARAALSAAEPAQPVTAPLVVPITNFEDLGTLLRKESVLEAEKAQIRTNLGLYINGLGGFLGQRMAEAVNPLLAGNAELVDVEARIGETLLSLSMNTSFSEFKRAEEAYEAFREKLV